jgi:glycerophosphoryl diester phosphodiesterase
MLRSVLLYIICQFAILFSGFAQQLAHTQKALSDPHSTTVLIAAHRGAHLEAPENSMAAFRKAIDMGIDIIELDVRCTKDGVLVLMHDKTVDRTTDGKGLVSNFTFDEIRRFRLKHNGQLTEEKIPTLEEALLLAKGKIMIDLDIKTADCIQAIMTTVEKTGMESSCLFFVYEASHARAIKEKNTAFKVLARTHSEAEIDTLFSNASVEAVHIDNDHHTALVVEKIRRNGAHAWINALGDVDKKAAAGDPAAFEQVLQYGVNIIQTDQPALLKAYLVSTKRYHK